MWTLRANRRLLCDIRFPSLKEAVSWYVLNAFDSPFDVHVYEGKSRYATYHKG